MMRLKKWSWCACAALLALEASILFEDWAGFAVLPKGGAIDVSTYLYIAVPIILFAIVLIVGRR